MITGSKARKPGSKWRLWIEGRICLFEKNSQMYQKNTPECTEGKSCRSASQFQWQVRISVHKLRGVMEKGRDRDQMDSGKQKWLETDLCKYFPICLTSVTTRIIIWEIKPWTLRNY